MRRIPFAVVCDCRAVGSDLHWGKKVIGLSDCGLQCIAAVPAFMKVFFFVFPRCKRSQILIKFDAGALPKAVLRSVFRDIVYTRSIADNIKEIVAGNLQCLYNIYRIVRSRKNSTAGMFTFVFGINAVVVNLCFCCYNFLIQSRNCGDHFKR